MEGSDGIIGGGDIAGGGVRKSECSAPPNNCVAPTEEMLRRYSAVKGIELSDLTLFFRRGTPRAI
jgi:hypothetical protein